MLASLLLRCRCVDDLPSLFVELGYAADDGEPDGSWRPIARWRTFRVVAAGDADPRAAARARARQLAAAAQPGLVVALGSGTLAFAAPRLGISRSSPVLAIPTDRPDPLHLQALRELGPHPGSTALAHALRVGEVLTTERVGSRFFAAFRSLVERASPRAPVRDAADRRLLVLLPLTRILFLYFVQAKGWLDGRSDFLRASFDDALARRRHFQRAVLHPLCFGTLNRPPDLRTRRAQFGAIPYLNGGLFEPHPVERARGPAVLPNAFWREAFDEVFERFRFCVREGDEVDAVAPDMLGRVFEGVMDPRERRRSGTFYTPEPLVRDIVTASIATALAGDGIPVDRIDAALRGATAPGLDRHTMRRRIARVRVLDPAVGSGAFLLSALEVLTTARCEGSGRMPAYRRARVRRRILAGQLFGVDINPIAVRLAELRLWLAIVADDPETDVARVQPLPNLNAVVRQGDALLDALGAARAFGLATAATPSTRAVATARRAVFAARGAERAAALSVLRERELTAAREMITAALDRVRRTLAELGAVAASPDLFGARSGLTSAQERQRAALRIQLRDLRASARTVARGALPFFAFEIHHPDAMAAGGFGVVVGNPPWVRAERLPGRLRQTLSDRFRWWRAGGTRGFTHQPDLAVAFLERALELTTDGGVVGFLLPGKVASAGYAEVARARLVRDTTITYLHRVPERDAAGFAAAVYPLALVARKAPPPDEHHVRLGLGDGPVVPQHALGASGPWLLVGDGARHALATLRASAPSLSSVAPPILGVKTGADDVFLGVVAGRDAGCAQLRIRDREVVVETEMVRHGVRGRDLSAYRVTAGRGILWPYDPDGAVRQELPPRTAAWFAAHHGRLVRRTDYRHGPPWTLFRARAGLGPHRVAWADIARTGTAVALDEVAPESVPLNTCYVSHAPDREAALAIAATLNSVWARALIDVLGDEARGGYRRHNARTAGLVPIPRPGSARSRLATLSERAHRTHDIDADEIDTAVADALGLPVAVRAALQSLARDRR